MTISVGDKLPDVKMVKATENGPEQVSSADYFKGKKVALFSVPGAFTPTCSAKHLPGYVDKAGDLKSKGVDEIVATAVNDAFVMGAWEKATNGTGKLRYLSDWDAGFTKAIGLEADLSAGTLGIRSQRYSMIVEDGTVTALNIEDTPGTAVTSGAATLLEQL